MTGGILICHNIRTLRSLSLSIDRKKVVAARPEATKYRVLAGAARTLAGPSLRFMSPLFQMVKNSVEFGKAPDLGESASRELDLTKRRADGNL